VPVPTSTKVPDPQGPGCDAYRKANPAGTPGSIESMAVQTGSQALASNPELSTFSDAISGKLNPAINIVNVLDGGPYVVFAPTNAAFAKLDAATLNTLKTDPVVLLPTLFSQRRPGQDAHPGWSLGHRHRQGRRNQGQRCPGDLRLRHTWCLHLHDRRGADAADAGRGGGRVHDPDHNPDHDGQPDDDCSTDNDCSTDHDRLPDGQPDYHGTVPGGAVRDPGDHPGRLGDADHHEGRGLTPVLNRWKAP
jgi:uncharacterized surface protein with fasciclin (FAS1) repeats